MLQIATTTLKVLHLNLIRIAKLTSGTRSGKNIPKLWRLMGEQEAQAELRVRKVQVLRQPQQRRRKDSDSRRKAGLQLEPLVLPNLQLRRLVRERGKEVLLLALEDQTQEEGMVEHKKVKLVLKGQEERVESAELTN